MLQGTIFHKTRIPLQKWFLAIGLMINAKKSLSSCQMARDLEMNQHTAWYMMHRIRTGMASEAQLPLEGIVEMDETYVGGKLRWPNDYEDGVRKYWTKKVPVMGALARGGDVVADVADDVTKRSVVRFLKKYVRTATSTLMTDEFKSYQSVGNFMKHRTVNHSVWYVDGEIHTNTIEGFWSQLKRAWFGQHHHYKKDWMPLYIAEACWKYNRRYDEPSDTFEVFLENLAVPV